MRRKPAGAIRGQPDCGMPNGQLVLATHNAQKAAKTSKIALKAALDAGSSTL